MSAGLRYATDDFVRCTRTLCTGFSVQGLLFLNESFSEDGVQEYAVVRDGQQIESMTVSWMSRAELHNTIDVLLQGSDVDYGPVSPLIDEVEDHRCPLCA